MPSAGSFFGGGSSLIGSYSGTTTICTPLYDTINGTWAIASSGSSYLGSFFANTGTLANGDYVTYSVPLPQGTYKLGLLSHKGPSSGIVDIQLDGVVKITFDGYAAGTTYNIKTESTGIVIPGGVHTVKAVVNGKNASSSGYQANLVLIYFIKTG